jgi:hypothetical protein
MEKQQPINPRLERFEKHGAVNDVQLRKHGISPARYTMWQLSILNDRIPEGFDSFDGFFSYFESLFPREKPKSYWQTHKK